jgi:hypothetical protein
LTATRGLADAVSAVSSRVPEFGPALATAVDASRRKDPALAPFDGLDTLDPAT